MDNLLSRWPSYIVKPLRNSPELQGEFIRIQRRELSQNCFISRLKKGLLKRTEFAPKGLGVQESKQEVTKSYLTCQKNVWKNLSRVSNPLIQIQFVTRGQGLTTPRCKFGKKKKLFFFTFKICCKFLNCDFIHFCQLQMYLTQRQNKQLLGFFRIWRLLQLRFYIVLYC